MSKPDGGPAFPQPITFSPITNESYTPQGDGLGGMTLRDYFAAAAMRGLCSNPGGPYQANGMSGWGIVNCKEADIAGLAYVIADALLKARDQ